MPEGFANLKSAFSEIKAKDSEYERFKLINTHLLTRVQQMNSPAFLLPHVIDFIEKVNEENLLPKPYHFSDFELWLNHHTEEEENRLIRGKIVGKYVPREEYQLFFPIGMGNTFEGSHFVAGHFSPDVDTTVASFFGFLDAFAAKVGSGLHLWSLPGGPPNSPITRLFQEKMGNGLFKSLANTGKTLTLTAKDLLSQENVATHTGEILVSQLDHGVHDKAVLLVDKEGYYLGDWRSSDVEKVRQVIVLYKACLSWFKNHIHVQLISLFAQPKLHRRDLEKTAHEIFQLPIKASGPFKEFDRKEQKLLSAFLENVLKVKGETYFALIEALGGDLYTFYEEVTRLAQTELFDDKGNIVEERPTLFRALNALVNSLDAAAQSTRNFVEQLSIQMQIKERVLGSSPEYLLLHNEVEDIRLKLRNHGHLTVVFPTSSGKLYPLGVVRASDLRKKHLGSVTFRDFCNFDEVKMASYLSVISVIDHHKTTFLSETVPTALVGDTQSTNVLIAELAFLINDRYREKQDYFIHPEREYTEYLFYLHAILDDTDLLSKVTRRDVRCAASLVNRLRVLDGKKEGIALSFDDLSPKQAAKRLLQHPDLFAFYDAIYRDKEQQMQQALEESAKGEFAPLFSDTKEQNGCCRVGQTKLFATNFPTYQKYAYPMRKEWLRIAQQIAAYQPEMDLHLQMINTIPSSEEVFRGEEISYAHQDEIWFWVPQTAQGMGHLAAFLNAFQSAKEVQENRMELTVIGPNSEELGRNFERNFIAIPQKIGEEDYEGETLAILRFRAGTLNSRKSMISPSLPPLVS